MSEPDPRSDNEIALDSVMKAQGLLGQLTRYVAEMEAQDPPLDKDQLELVHEYAKSEAARLQSYIASISSAVLELQSITAPAAHPQPPGISQPPPRPYFARSPADDLRRQAIKASTLDAAQQEK
jgi:hypothetical protein